MLTESCSAEEEEGGQHAMAVASGERELRKGRGDRICKRVNTGLRQMEWEEEV